MLVVALNTEHRKCKVPAVTLNAASPFNITMTLLCLRQKKKDFSSIYCYTLQMKFRYSTEERTFSNFFFMGYKQYLIW